MKCIREEDSCPFPKFSVLGTACFPFYSLIKKTLLPQVPDELTFARDVELLTSLANYFRNAVYHQQVASFKAHCVMNCHCCSLLNVPTSLA